MTTKFPDPRAGEFTHRINEVPDVGSMIEFHDKAGQTFIATVHEAEHGSEYAGLGDDVRLVLASGPARGMTVQPSVGMVEWRYVG